jgi:hypothetical protein
MDVIQHIYHPYGCHSTYLSSLWMSFNIFIILVDVIQHIYHPYGCHLKGKAIM